MQQTDLQAQAAIGLPVDRGSARTRRPPPSAWRWVPLGLALLLWAPTYFACPSLMLDESRLVLNVAARSWGGLLQPLDYDQAAPVLFLWLEKAATVVGGVNEYALRALPFFAAMMAVVMTYLLARRVSSEGAAVLAAALVAASPLMLQLSHQAKPYTVDTAVVLVLVWLAFQWADRPTDAVSTLILMAAGAAAVWVSYPAVFADVGIVAALSAGHASVRAPGRRLVAMTLLWGASFAVAYLVLYRVPAGNRYLHQFWQGSLLSVWEPGVPARLWQGIREILWQTFAGGSTEPPLRPVDNAIIDVSAAALIALGTAGARRLAATVGSARGALLGSAIAVAFFASFAGYYPIAARVMLFAAPLLTIIIAIGAVGLADRMPAFRPATVALVCACLFGLSLPLDITLTLHPRSEEDVRSAVRVFRSQHRTGEAVYIFPASLPQWTFYTTDWHAPDTIRLQRVARLASSNGPAFENAPPRGAALRPGTGDSLVFPFADGWELIGLFHGAQWRSGTGLVQSAPDTNWTLNEARRIRNAGEKGIWVLMSRTRGLERYLYPATQMCLDRRYDDHWVHLAHFVPRPLSGLSCGAAETFPLKGR